MELIHIAQLVGIYMVIGLVFGAMYCSDNTSDDMQVDFFYDRWYEWCEKNDISYSGMMIIYGMFLWPTIVLHMICCVVYFIGLAIFAFFETLYKIARAITKTS